MQPNRSLYYTCLLLFSYAANVLPLPCHICTTKTYDYVVTNETLPSPTEEECHIIQATHGCYIHIEWLDNGGTYLYYDVDPALPYNSITTVLERTMLMSTGKYSTRQSLGYACRSNRTACNSVRHLRRAMTALTLPSAGDISQFDPLLVAASNFNVSSCAEMGRERNCPKVNVSQCEQCLSTARFKDRTEVCHTCLTERAKKNSFVYSTVFHINKVTRAEEIKLVCQNGEMCNGMDNIEEIKHNLTTTLNLLKFYHSAASTVDSTRALMLSLAFVGLIRSMLQ